MISVHNFFDPMIVRVLTDIDSPQLCELILWPVADSTRLALAETPDAHPQSFQIYRGLCVRH